VKPAYNTHQCTTSIASTGEEDGLQKIGQVYDTTHVIQYVTKRHTVTCSYVGWTGVRNY